MPSATTLVLEFIRGNGGSHSTWSRFVVALWGCLVLHASLILFGNANDTITSQDLQLFGLALLVAILFYSCTFAVIVAIGVPKGSLVRHFIYGITLPALCYLIAGNIMKNI